jgi:adenine-specific DNA-methyltransferase
LVYAQNAKSFKESRNRLPYDAEVLKRYKNPDNDPRGPWQSISLNVQAGHATKSQFFTIASPNGNKHYPPSGRCWMYNAHRIAELIADNRIWFGKGNAGVPRLKRFLSEIKGGLTPHTLWKAEEVGTTETAKKDLLGQFPDIEVFDTPKPEGLVRRILEIATNPGDLVLDSFLGSGTTAAVALKTDRRFIGIEQGDHVVSHCHRRIAPLARDSGASVRFYQLS